MASVELVVLRASSIEPGPRRRVALYSHDTQGLGHVRRNLAIAAALSHGEPAPDILLLTGAAETAVLARPAHCDIVTLPALRKDLDGSYAPRNLSGSLAALISMRSAVLASALEAFAPDLLIVDKVPGGAFGELGPALERLRAGGRTRTVLGLRDVLDDPAATRREWRAQRATAAVERWYDAVWVYGDRRVVDPVREYALPPAVASRLTFTGYLARGRGADAPTAVSGPPVVLGIVGGGQDGRRLAESFAQAPLPAGHRGVLVCGPHMPEDDRAQVRRLAADRKDLDVRAFAPGLERWIAGAAAVVSMGGYNSVCELLASGAPALVVPRVAPRTEQLIRADRLAARGALDCLHPSELSPHALGTWLRGAVRRGRRRIDGRLDLDGLARLPGLAGELLGGAAGREVAGVAA